MKSLMITTIRVCIVLVGVVTLAGCPPCDCNFLADCTFGSVDDKVYECNPSAKCDTEGKGQGFLYKCTEVSSGTTSGTPGTTPP